MLRAIIVSALVACASGFEMAAARPGRLSAFSAARAPRAAVPVSQPSSRAIMMSEGPMADEPTPQQSAIAVAITAGFFGVYVLDNLVTAALLAGLAAYLTTTDSQAGDVATSTGKLGYSAYKTVVNFAREKDVLPKAKTVTDKVVSAVQRIDNNYGLSAKIDEKLLISEKVSAASDKLSEVKTTVTTKVNDFTASLK